MPCTSVFAEGGLAKARKNWAGLVGADDDVSRINGLVS